MDKADTQIRAGDKVLNYADRLLTAIVNYVNEEYSGEPRRLDLSKDIKIYDSSKDFIKIGATVEALAKLVNQKINPRPTDSEKNYIKAALTLLEKNQLLIKQIKQGQSIWKIELNFNQTQLDDAKSNLAKRVNELKISQKNSQKLSSSNIASQSENLSDTPLTYEQIIGHKIDCNKPEDRIEWCLVVSGKLGDYNKDIIEAIIVHLQDLLAEPHITFKKIESGSVVIFLESSRLSWEIIYHLFRQGYLDEILDKQIMDVKIGDPRAWLESLFAQDWQPIEQLQIRAASARRTPDLNNTFPFIISKGKLIHLTDNITSIIFLKFDYQRIPEIHTVCQIYPDSESYLPINLTIEVLDLAGSVVMLERVAQPNIDAIELSFTSEIEEHFSLRITYQSLEIIEQF